MPKKFLAKRLNLPHCGDCGRFAEFVIDGVYLCPRHLKKFAKDNPVIIISQGDDKINLPNYKKNSGDLLYRSASFVQPRNNKFAYQKQKGLPFIQDKPETDPAYILSELSEEFIISREFRTVGSGGDEFCDGLSKKIPMEIRKVKCSEGIFELTIQKGKLIRSKRIAIADKEDE